MKKIGKKLSYFTKLFLAFGLLFNNISSFVVVFADETTGTDTVISDDANTNDGKGDKEVESGENDSGGSEQKNDENNDNDEAGGSGTTGGDDATLGDGENETPSGGNENNDNNNENPESGNDAGGDTGLDNKEVEFSAIYSASDNGIIIKYSDASNLEEGVMLNISEDFTYLDGTTYGEVTNQISITDEMKASLATGGHLYVSDILNDNAYDGNYVATVSIGDREVTVNGEIKNESGYVLELYDGDTKLSPVDGVYTVSKDTEKLNVKIHVLLGGASPQTVYTIGENQYTVQEMFDGVDASELELAGYLYGIGTYDVSVTVNDSNNGELVANESYRIKYGTYQDNTDRLNESAKSIELADRYMFLGDTENGTIYIGGVITEEDVYSIISVFIGEEGKISPTADINGDDVTMTFTDIHGVTVTYKGPVKIDDAKVNAELTLEDENIESGTEFSVKYFATLKDLSINGFSGMFSYDPEMFELVSVENQVFDGNVMDDQFLYSGTDKITGELITNDDGSEEITEKEHVLLIATFKALTSGSSDIVIDKAKFYNDSVYYENLEDLSVTVTVNESNDNTLESLMVAGQKISLEDGVYDYEITVGADVTDPAVEAILANDSAEIVSIVSPEELAAGENTITITVEAANGEVVVYTVKVVREEAKEENTNNQATVAPVNYVPETYTDNTDNNDDNEPTITDTSTDTKIDGGEDDKKEEEKSGKLSRLIIILLILLVIAGLMYLIFKDDKDDEETKQVNKDINKYKNIDIDYKEKNNHNHDNNHNNNHGNNNHNNNHNNNANRNNNSNKKNNYKKGR